MTEAFRVTELAAAKRHRNRRPRRQPVTTITVDRRVWATALRIAGGDPRRITIVSRTRVEIEGTS